MPQFPAQDRRTLSEHYKLEQAMKAQNLFQKAGMAAHMETSRSSSYSSTVYRHRSGQRRRHAAYVETRRGSRWHAS